MTAEGQTVLFKFPQTDQLVGKLRPALVIRRVPGQYDDWLVCMISSRLEHEITGFDEVLRLGDADFDKSGLRVTSLLRIGRLAVVNKDVLVGQIGEIDSGPGSLRRKLPGPFLCLHFACKR
jgi:mRNA interferase MazF